MQLIASLRAGIRGAENGTVDLYRRGGTSTRVTWYSDFEATSGDATGASVALDENGAVTVYVNELVLCVVKDSDGVELCRFVDGHAAGAVEYRGEGFAGVRYDDATAGVGSDYPTELQTILDSVVDSFGTYGWYVSINGTRVTVMSALGAVAGLFFNVKDPAYGAVGDGVANDTAAIDAAITAATAGGGVVYFPPGTYLRTTTITLPAKVSLMGAGPNASTLSINHASNPLISTASSTYPFRKISGLRLTAAQASSGNVISFGASSVVVVENCYIGGANCDQTLIGAIDSAVTTYRFENCTFEIGALDVSAVVHGGAVKRATYSGCRFITPVGNYNPSDGGVVVADNIDLVGCEFDGALSTGGTFSYYQALTTTLSATLRGCRFLSTGGGTATAITLGTYVAASVFYEDDSVFGTSGVTAYSYTVSGAQDGAQVELRSRDRRWLTVAIDATPYEIPLAQYGMVHITSTVAGNVTFTASQPPAGAHGHVRVQNGDGSSRDFTTNSPFQESTANTIGNGSEDGFDYYAFINPVANLARLANVWID